ncbi:MAG: hypothetical protein KDF64_04020 [Geminicoccaceae bacterium]|nr:hypothetical protein [Geminicoccaceae bacterium]
MTRVGLAQLGTMQAPVAAGGGSPPSPPSPPPPPPPPPPPASVTIGEVTAFKIFAGLSTSGSWSYTHAGGTNSGLGVVIAGRKSGGVDPALAVTFNGTTVPVAAESTNTAGGGNVILQTCILAGADAGEHTLAWSSAADMYDLVALVFDIAGLDQSTPVGSTPGVGEEHDTTGATIAASVTPDAATSLLLTAWGSTIGTTAEPSAGWTELADEASEAGSGTSIVSAAIATKAAAGTSAETVTWTQAAADDSRAALAIELRRA